MMWAGTPTSLNPGRFNTADTVATSLSTNTIPSPASTQAIGMSVPAGNMLLELVVAGLTPTYSGGSVVGIPAVPVEAHVGQRDGIVAGGLLTPYFAVFQANHSAATKRAVVNWLASRYGLVA